MASDGNYVIFCDLDEITSMGSSKMGINDYLITDPDMFKALVTLLDGMQVQNISDERLSLLFFDYLEAKYPTYSYH